MQLSCPENEKSCIVNSSIVNHITMCVVYRYIHNVSGHLFFPNMSVTYEIHLKGFIKQFLAKILVQFLNLSSSKCSLKKNIPPKMPNPNPISQVNQNALCPEIKTNRSKFLTREQLSGFQVSGLIQGHNREAQLQKLVHLHPAFSSSHLKSFEQYKNPIKSYLSFTLDTRWASRPQNISAGSPLTAMHLGSLYTYA